MLCIMEKLSMKTILIENNYFNFLKMFGGEQNNVINCGEFKQRIYKKENPK